MNKVEMCKKIFSPSQKDFKRQKVVSCDTSLTKFVFLQKLEETELVNRNIQNLNCFRENRISVGDFREYS